MADQNAHKALEKVFEDAGMAGTNSNTELSLPAQITIETYSIQPKTVSKWTEFIKYHHRTAIAKNKPKVSMFQHSIAPYFKLLKNIDTLLYVDTDVLFVSNVASVWEQQIPLDDTTKYFYSTTKSATPGGFVILKPRFLKQLWHLYITADVHPKSLVVGDSYILQTIQRNHPEYVGWLKNEWDVYPLGIADQAYGKEDEPNSLVIREHSNGIGYMHFNRHGQGDTNSIAFFDRDDPNINKQHQTRPQSRCMTSVYWNLAKYYVDLPWKWVFHQLRSKIPAHGTSYELKLNYK
jgi:hypothetical protein